MIVRRCTCLRVPVIPRLNGAMKISTPLQSYCPRADGWIFFIFGFIWFLGFPYAAVISKFLPVAESHITRAIQSDRYYCFLVPVTPLIFVVMVYFHWLCMKLFRHA